MVLSSRVRFTQGFFFIAVLKPTVNESFSVGIMLPPVPVYPNSYMLDMCSNKQEERRCGLKPQRHEDPQKEFVHIYIPFIVIRERN